MSTDLHDIRLLAGFEIRPDSVSERTLSRDQAEKVVTALAADLARVVPGIDRAVLVGAGALLEPAEMLRPGWPAWSALADLAAPLVRQQDSAPGVMAIGSHGGRLPDRRLTPPAARPQGQFLAIPLLLVTDTVTGPELEAMLESELFERGGIDPPARAALERFSGAQSAHGQLLTATDLLALQHVQMDAGGLSAFWPAIEQALLAPERDADFELPAGLEARWSATQKTLDMDFVVFDHFEGSPENYLLWHRAFRLLAMLAESHGLDWRVRVAPGLTLDKALQLVIQDAGPVSAEDSLTEQFEPDIGLIAWTVVENGILRHIYPLSAEAAGEQGANLMRRFQRVHRPGRLCYLGNPPRIQAAHSE